MFFRKNKMIVILAAIFTAIIMFAMLFGCATATPKYKKDCRGNKHERLSNGIYL